MKRTPHLVQSPSAFVQFVACNLMPWGYRFVVTGRVKPGQDPERIDQSLIQKYNCNLGRGKTAYRKSQGIASVRYIRCNDFWAMFATHGQHRFFDEHQAQDRRRRQLMSLVDRRLHFHGYSIGLVRREDHGKEDIPGRGSGGGGYRSHVSIGRSAYRELRAELLDLSTKRSVEDIRRRIYTVPFEPYGPVIEQMREILYQVNRRRKAAGFGSIDPDCVRVSRDLTKIFVTITGVESESIF